MLADARVIDQMLPGENLWPETKTRCVRLASDDFKESLDIIEALLRNCENNQITSTLLRAREKLYIVFTVAFRSPWKVQRTSSERVLGYYPSELRRNELPSQTRFVDRTQQRGSRVRERERIFCLTARRERGVLVCDKGSSLR